ncbi:MAG: HNH endonuclease [Promethearchaeota archaeon]
MIFGLIAFFFFCLFIALLTVYLLKWHRIEKLNEHAHPYHLKICRKNCYIDNRGYLRWKVSEKLVHRDIAYCSLYQQNRDKYPMRFSRYVVHHVDKNKLNDNPSNLMVLTPEEHRQYHPHLRRGGLMNDK